MTEQHSLATRATELGLVRVGGRPTLGAYLRDVLGRREFITSLAKFRIEAENQRNRLGMAWVVIRPLLNAAVFGLVFGILMNSARTTPDFIAFLVIGVFMFEFFSSSLTAGAKAITANGSLVQSLSFPRMALPVSVVTQKFLQLVPALLVMLVMLVVMGHWPRWEWLLMVPLVALFYLFNIGLALVASRMTVHIRDLVNLLPFVTRLMFYTTGIFFAAEIRFADHPEALRILDFQPVYTFLTLARALLLDGHPIYEVRPELWAIAGAWAVILVLVGVVFFWAAEERYGRVD